MASAVPGTLTAHLAAEQTCVKEAAAWCVLNLSSSDTPSQQPQVGYYRETLFPCWQEAEEKEDAPSCLVQHSCSVVQPNTGAVQPNSEADLAVGARADTYGSLHIAGQPGKGSQPECAQD